MTKVDMTWLSNLEYLCRKRGIDTWVVHPGAWILGDQMTLGMRKNGQERYVVYTNGCDVDLTIKEILRYIEELDPKEECEECRL